jgi:hypothetical protein
MAGGMDLARLKAPHEVVFSGGDRQAKPLLVFYEVGLLGQASLDSAIQIQGMNSTLQSMANAIVAQIMKISN